MGPLPFDEREHIESGALYVVALGIALTFITWIETTHSLAHGMIAGGIAIVVLLCVGALARRAAR